MPKRNRHRAARRNAKRTAENALRLAHGAELAAEPPKRKNARSKTVLEILAMRGAISISQKRAGERLERDYRFSGSQLGRLITNYEQLGSPRIQGNKHSSADTPGGIAARRRYDAAMRAVGPWLAPILVHSVVCDQPAIEWGPLNGKAERDGPPVLRLALDALSDHYRSLSQAAA